MGWRTGDWCVGSVDEPVSALQVSVGFQKGDTRQANPKVPVASTPLPVAAVGTPAWDLATAEIGGRHAAQHASQSLHKLPEPRLADNRFAPLHATRLPDNRLEVMPMATELRVVAAITAFVLIIALFMYIAYDYYTRWADKRQACRHSKLHATSLGQVLTAVPRMPYSLAPHASPDWRARMAWRPQQPPLRHDDQVSAKPACRPTPPELAAAIAMFAAADQQR